MALSADLQQRLTTEIDQDWWEGIVLTHPYMTTICLCSDSEDRQGYVDGVLRTFTAAPIVVPDPDRNAEGRTDVQIQICAVGGEAQSFVAQAAADRSQSITLRYGRWLRDDPTQKVDPLPSVSVTDVLLGDELVLLSASATDVLNRPFPSQLYTIGRFPGLDRR